MTLLEIGEPQVKSMLGEPERECVGSSVGPAIHTQPNSSDQSTESRDGPSEQNMCWGADTWIDSPTHILTLANKAHRQHSSLCSPFMEVLQDLLQEILDSIKSHE